ncbi:MAG: endolytic transglycosylase MltG [Halothiobacillaceae bacterium]
MLRGFSMLAVWLGTLLLVLGLSAGLTLWQQQSAVMVHAGGEAPVEVIVPEGAGVGQVGVLLQDRGLLPDGRVLAWLARLEGKAARLHAGEYRIAPDTSLRQVLDDMVNGRVVTYRLTVPEGATFEQFRRTVANAKVLKQTLDAQTPDGLIDALGLDLAHPEGWFFPDTYVYRRGDTDRDIFLQAHRAMRARLEAAWSARDPDLPLSDPYEMLILASIVERETGVAAERPEVAGVFVNRIARGMRLQSDPTIIYGLGEDYRGAIYRSDLKRDTPYNTYTRDGLPPTPIALPGRAALDAVSRPAESDYLYFVADAQGGHVFSRTLDEHNRAVRAYRRALAESP